MSERVKLRERAAKPADKNTDRKLVGRKQRKEEDVRREER